MSTYAIGDVQGCYEPLIQLLEKINFNPSCDQLLFAGDIINRGPDSLKTIDFIKGLGNKAICVLGNHDLSLLARSVNAIKPKKKDTFEPILEAPHAHELVNWLKQQPLAYQHSSGFFMSHAGLYPLWSTQQALALAQEVHEILIGDQFETFMHHMFGSKPDIWSEELEGWDRLRFITNSLTRMRYCTNNGKLDLKTKGSPKKQKNQSIPWFLYPNPHLNGAKIIFGHWASLKGECEVENIQALDTGCVWGGCLTAFCLENEERFHINCG